MGEGLLRGGETEKQCTCKALEHDGPAALECPGLRDAFPWFDSTGCAWQVMKA